MLDHYTCATWTTAWSIDFEQYLWPKCEEFVVNINKTCVITIDIHMAT